MNNLLKKVAYPVLVLAFQPVFYGNVLEDRSSQVEAQANGISPTPLVRLEDSSDLELNLAAGSQIPAGLSQSDNPAAGRRGVINEDDRVLMTSQSFPWTAVGRINGITAEGENYICTGTLIADAVVLTNAHCVLNPDTGMLSRSIVFLPNLIHGQVASEADVGQVEAVLVGTDFRDRNQPPHPDDWALLKLDQPLGQKYGTVGLSRLDAEALATDPFTEQLIMVAYSSDFPAAAAGETASAHLGCSIVGETEEEVIEHACDTHGGSSGGPIFAIINGEPRIVALNAAEEVDPDSEVGIVNYAVKIERIVAAIEAELATDR
ncbi:trypsin-like peptidase domain-containing protein [Pseudanabaena sp. FACHB-2040]|uniref:trypsin-like serine peptidase n=1 Tax=Pseudanabaena sp. FACHB-2040 TaxID=2692859 RepID=UPI0016870085|nr:trypsin-like peptidase domain-containing protein [Pseudanabaena sp. FACHB-2040]MBD2259314.1 trypsin-like peptidase domain-containing protein [Pseudanabaena sp. FACHB-2040]